MDSRINIDRTNTMFQLALGLVNQSTRNIFLTGKAGTGKTTFLRYIRENCGKQIAIVAPTGVAAINAGGVTIHSFFQLPLSPFLPDESTGFAPSPHEVTNSSALINRLRMTRERIRVLEELELLIIDEISMVRADTLDAVDTVLRHIRKRPLDRFGGVQVLFIGDMFQLPPVTRDDVWQHLSGYYKSPYFFDSRVLQEELPVYVEFNKVYRQNEEDFIRLLNGVRNNEVDDIGFELLEKRYDPGFEPHPSDGFIILTTHNEAVRKINTEELQKLTAKRFYFNAEVKGDFPGGSFPADETLVLCKGAQVMFVKNDTEKEKRFFNGKIGFVSNIDNEKIWVKCGEEEEIEVKKEKWENIRYSVNPASRVLEEETLGSFSQYPVRLAWAITVHKSQGLTFERAIIDAGKAFAPGQVYVALSRCTSLEGLVLKSRINQGSLRNDPRIVRFAENSVSVEELKEELRIATAVARRELLFQVFDFPRESGLVNELSLFIRKHLNSFQGESLSWLEKLEQLVGGLRETGLRFHDWIKQQLQAGSPVDGNVLIAERAKRATVHFSGGLKDIVSHLQACTISTDNRLNAREVNERLRELFGAVSLHIYLLERYSLAIDLEHWQREKRAFRVPGYTINVFGGAVEAKKGLEHPALYWKLKQLRDTISAKREQSLYKVASSRTLEELVNYLPQTEAELESISGFGKVKVRAYGNEFLRLIRAYCEERGLESNVPASNKKVSRKTKRQTNKSTLPEELKHLPSTGDKAESSVWRTDTRAVSYQMFVEGMSVDDIAAARALKPQTIEGHLAHYVGLGEIDIKKLVPAGRVERIAGAIGGIEAVTVRGLKDLLGDEIGFGEIRLVLAWWNWKKEMDD